MLLLSRPGRVEGAWGHRTTCCPHRGDPSPTPGQKRARDSRARLAAPARCARGDTAAAQGPNPSCDPPSSSSSPDFWGLVLVKCATAVLLSDMVWGLMHLPLPRAGTASRLHPVLLQLLVALLHRLQFGGFDFHPCFCWEVRNGPCVQTRWQCRHGSCDPGLIWKLLNQNDMLLA